MHFVRLMVVLGLAASSSTVSIAQNGNGTVNVLKSDCLEINQISPTQHHLQIKYRAVAIQGCPLAGPEMILAVWPASKVDEKILSVEKEFDAFKSRVVLREQNDRTVASLLETIRALEARVKKVEEKLPRN